MAVAPRYLLDTNICLYFRKRQSASVIARFEELAPGEAAISAVTLGELYFGAVKSSRREQSMHAIQLLLEELLVLPIGPETAFYYGKVRAPLQKLGTPIGGNDLWIAAQALERNITLVTNNHNEFRRVPGLSIENWT